MVGEEVEGGTGGLRLGRAIISLRRRHDAAPIEPARDGAEYALHFQRLRRRLATALTSAVIPA